jgi:tetratricopeptide (TPR) repeat protein
VLAELEEAPPSRPAPKAPRPPRETKSAEAAKPAAPPKRRAAERPAPAPEDPSDRYVRADLGAGEPRARAGKPRADRSGPLAALKGRGNARYIVSAVFCTGVLLVVAGLAQAWISRAVSSADLPQVNAAAQLPDGLTALLGDATARLVAGEPDQAMKVLEDAAVAWPEYQSAIATARVRTLRAKGTRHLAAREYPKAIEAYRAAAELEPKAADNWIELGRAYREHGRSRQASNASEGRTLLNKAVASYRRALEIQADNGTAMVGLAQAFTFLNDRKGAVAMYEKVLAQAPNSPEASIARQNLAQLTGRV